MTREHFTPDGDGDDRSGAAVESQHADDAGIWTGVGEGLTPAGLLVRFVSVSDLLRGNFGEISATAIKERFDGLSDDFQLFSGLDESAIAEIRQHAVIRRFPKNTIVVTEGDDTDSLYLIESGRVKFFLSDEEGQEVILNFQEAGTYFGELSLLDGAPRSVSVMTMEPTTLAVVSRDNFLQCLRQHPDISLNILIHMAARLRELSDEVRALALADTYGRIKRLFEHQARTQRDGKVAVRKMTHQQISQMVGASREMVSRIMKDLVTGGYIEPDQTRYVLRKALPKRR